MTKIWDQYIEARAKVWKGHQEIGETVESLELIILASPPEIKRHLEKVRLRLFSAGQSVAAGSDTWTNVTGAFYNGYKENAEQSEQKKAAPKSPLP